MGLQVVTGGKKKFLNFLSTPQKLQTRTSQFFIYRRIFKYQGNLNTKATDPHSPYICLSTEKEYLQNQVNIVHPLKLTYLNFNSFGETLNRSESNPNKL